MSEHQTNHYMSLKTNKTAKYYISVIEYVYVAKLASFNNNHDKKHFDAIYSNKAITSLLYASADKGSFLRRKLRLSTRRRHFRVDWRERARFLRVRPPLWPSRGGLKPGGHFPFLPFTDSMTNVNFERRQRS
ncbi:hypothetical protein EVAR_99868_1 [Eumeta japonica]|uniref:Uncharacterized protein n=1 Tax=Eumeta variegata TaxID=151549 RepID=A0A4C1ZKJ1_EUMVA|nr:hypothetical protein EVAR_99868_1 [Eumeta japonica]